MFQEKCGPQQNDQIPCGYLTFQETIAKLYRVETVKSRSEKWKLEQTKITDEFQQAGTELGQAQLKLGLDFTPIFCRFGISGFCFYFAGLIEKDKL